MGCRISFPQREQLLIQMHGTYPPRTMRRVNE
jgi:hypothetical protein